jgi:catechol 2,3-dioxygenase-like lactoylglutathione lyase family enzyme
MPQVMGIDHIAITVSDLEATCAFYDRLFGARTHLERVVDGKVKVRQIALGGGALTSVHQAGNDVALVGRHPTIGAGDICLRWEGSLDTAAELLRQHGIEIIAGPAPRRTGDELPSHSIYFRDLDGNLLELMATD